MITTSQTLYRNLTLCILFVAYNSTSQWSSISLGNTFVNWTLFALIVLYIYRHRDKSTPIWPISLFAVYIIIMAVYGALFMASYYWDYKLLVGNLLSISLCVVAFTFCKPDDFSLMMKGWMRYAFFLILILLPFTGSDGIGRMMMPFAMMALFWRNLKLRNKTIILVTFLFTLIIGIDNRSDIIKYSVALLLGVSLSISVVSKTVKHLYKYIVVVLLIAPVVFCGLGLFNVFNIFEIDEELGWHGKYSTTSSTGKETNLVSDTRTFLYVEEILSAVNNNYVIFGRSPARGYDSVAFAKADMVKYRSERGSCEVCILNIFNYYGVIGVLLYFTIFMYSVFFVYKHSNNDYIRILSMYLSFLWFYSWVHNTTEFNTTTFMTFVMVGMCCSKKMNNMNDEDFAKQISSIQK